MTYQLIPRSEITAGTPLTQDLSPNAWASDWANKIYVLVEKRWRLAAGQEKALLPAAWNSGDATFVSGGPSSSVLADGLAPVEAETAPTTTAVAYSAASPATSPIKFLSYDAATRRFDLYLRPFHFQHPQSPSGAMN